MPKRKKRSRVRKEAGVSLPERLALTTLIDPTSLLSGAGGLTGAQQTIPSTPADSTTGGSDPLGGAMSNVGSLSSQAQQSGSGATAQNIGSDGATSTATTPPPQPPT
jgi:hypothetical protein